METWLIIISSLCIPAILKAVFNLLYPSRRPTHNLPPSPFTFPIIESLSWLPKTFADLEPILRDLHPKFGPMVGIGPHPAIFISDRFLIHQALVQNGAVLADRPPALIACRIINSNQRTIDTTVYGLTWRVLRRNLTAEILNHSRVKSYSHGRKLVLQILKEKLSVKAGEAVLVVNYLRYAMCCLLVLKCFGDKLDESQMKKIKVAQHCVLLNVEVFNLINFWPKVTQILFCKKWKYIFQIHKNQEDLLIPLIKARKKVKKENLSKEKEDKKIEDKEEHIGTVNFYIAEMGWDPKVWEDPMAFRPDRFLNSDGGEEVFDLTGRKEIKMIQFGAGRRICPAYGLAMLHLEYFVANLVLSFEWKAVDGDDIDLSEKQEFTMVMKNPL
ncbi:hypothetical protein SCA6_002682 [Theobroma cacao]